MALKAFYTCLPTAATAGERCIEPGARAKWQHRAHHGHSQQLVKQSAVHTTWPGVPQKAGLLQPSTGLLLYRQKISLRLHHMHDSHAALQCG